MATPRTRCTTSSLVRPCPHSRSMRATRSKPKRSAMYFTIIELA
ncbi:MAG: hypothetical protein M5U28_46690 [Sandaracinaceae bacterium]|nr:hypothetical protein [Sandaracinaceae bacterium]